MTKQTFLTHCINTYNTPPPTTPSTKTLKPLYSAMRTTANGTPS